MKLAFLPIVTLTFENSPKIGRNLFLRQTAAAAVALAKCAKDDNSNNRNENSGPQQKTS